MITYSEKNSKNLDGTLRETFAGAVLELTGRDVRVMSDVYSWVYYANVWTGSEVLEIAYNYSEFPTGNTAEVDATEDVKAAAHAYHVARTRENLIMSRGESVTRAVKASQEVLKGRGVTVVRGRKISKGETGIIFWMGQTQFGIRVGLQLDATGERVFTDVKNVEVTNPAKYYSEPAMLTDAEIVVRAAETAKRY